MVDVLERSAGSTNYGGLPVEVVALCKREVSAANRGLAKLRPRPRAGHDLEDELKQALLLAIPPYSEKKRTEIGRVCRSTVISHCLDDVVDAPDCNIFRSRSEREIRGLTRWGPSEKAMGARFAALYRKPVEEVFGKGSLGAIRAMLMGCAGSVKTRGMLYTGLVRMAFGSVMFKPGIPAKTRELVLREHNRGVVELVRTPSIRSYLSSLVGRKGGREWLGLTTKVIMETFTAAGGKVDFDVEILHGLLGTACLYFHDIKSEVARGEMRRADAFESFLTSDRIRELLALVKSTPHRRSAARMAQFDAVIHAFGPHLPRPVKSALCVK